MRDENIHAVVCPCCAPLSRRWYRAAGLNINRNYAIYTVESLLDRNSILVDPFNWITRRVVENAARRLIRTSFNSRFR